MHGSAGETTYTVAEVWRYPVKSMQGERLDRACLDERGIVGDRGRALIDARTGKLASGSYTARRWADLVTWSASYTEDPRAGGGLPDVRIAPPSGPALAADAPGTDAALSQRLGRDVRLAVAGQEDDAVTHGDRPPGSFLDVGPVHLLTTGTLAGLSRSAPAAAFDPRRFRPNLVIDTGTDVAFPEDGWLGRTLTLGSAVRLRITSRSPRCVMTTHAQGRLPKDREVLAAAARTNGGNVGVYAEVLAPGVVHVGDEVQVTPPPPAVRQPAPRAR